MRKRLLGVAAAFLSITVMLSACNNGISSSDTSSDASNDTANSSDTASQPVGTETPSGADVAYEWGNVQIAGGGYVPEIIYNPTEEGLLYARTDMGGAYRMDKETGLWVQLVDRFGTKEYSMYGIDGLATDPVEPNRVYLLAGMYTNGWLEMTSAYILASEDYGANWEMIEMPFAAGGNEPNRFADRLTIDPNDNKTLYCGARTGDLYISHDYGRTWTTAALPKVSEYYWEDGYRFGITFISVDKSSGGDGKASQDIYVGVAAEDNRIFVSHDGGVTWAALEGQPTRYVPYHGVVSEDGYIYFVYGNKAGPYTVTAGAIEKYNTSTGEWTNVTPEDKGWGYGDVAIDPTDPKVLYASTIGKWGGNENDTMYRSTDGGETWTALFTGDGENRIFDLDISDAPWLSWGSGRAKLGWMMGNIAINPFNNDEIMYGTGATIYRSTNLTKWGTDELVHFVSTAKGIEETAVNDLCAPLSGDVQLYSAMGDLDGFSHKDVDVVEKRLNGNGSIGNATSIDCAGQAPNIAARCGNASQIVEITQDYGTKWKRSKPDGAKGQGGTVAVNADGTAIYWTSSDVTGIFATYDLGDTWVKLEKPFINANIACDRVDPDALYVTTGGTLYVSRDKGASFTAIDQLCPDNARIAVNPLKAGEIWIASPAGGVFLYDNYGTSEYVRKSGMVSAQQLAFGKAAEGSDKPAMYVIGTTKEIETIEIYRSIDGGETWQRINDDKHRFGSIGNSLAADMNVFGQVYFGTNGRGIVMGRSVE